MKLSENARSELAEMRRQNALLSPVDIVQRARSSNSALHDLFEWNDTEAAHLYRLRQARGLLKVYVQTSSAKRPELKKITVQATSIAPLPAPKVALLLEGDVVTRFYSDLRNLIAKYQGQSLLGHEIAQLSQITRQVEKEDAPAAPQRIGRRCLSCSRVFESAGAGNRICPTCSKRTDAGIYAPQ